MPRQVPLSLASRHPIPRLRSWDRTEGIVYLDPPLAPDPPGEYVAQEPPHGFLDPRPADPKAPVNGPAHARGKQFEAAHFAHATGPEEFVRLGAAQEVVLCDALLDGVLDRQAHRDEADALL